MPWVRGRLEGLYAPRAVDEIPAKLSPALAFGKLLSLVELLSQLRCRVKNKRKDDER